MTRESRKASTLELLRRGTGLLTRRERWLAVLHSILIVVAELLQMAALVLVLPVVSMVVEPNLMESSKPLVMLSHWFGGPTPKQFVLILGSASLCFVVIGNLFYFLVQGAVEVFTARTQTRLASDLMAACTAAPYPWFLERNASMLVRLFHNDMSLWGREFVGNLLRVLMNVLTVALGAGVVLVAAPIGGLALLAMVMALTYGALRVVRPQLVYWTTIKRRAADDTMVLETQILSGIKDVKISDDQGYFVRMFAKTYANMSRAAARGVMYGQLPASILLMVGQASLLLVAIVLWFSGARGGEVASQMALIVLVTSRVVPAVTRLSSLISSVINAAPFVSGIIELRDSIEVARQAAQIPVETTPVSAGWVHIRFEDVTFSYHPNGDPVLVGIDLTLDRGRSYGLTGPSGAGKSTFVDLLTGLLRPSGGRILVDAVPLISINPASWLAHIGYVPQNPYFADDTLIANIAFGVPPRAADRARVERCIELVGLSDIVTALPQGIDTRIGDRGLRFSGGQRQRVAIARALYRNPNVLILDEATGQLDEASEDIVLQTLEGLRDKVTTLVISHRARTVRACDHQLAFVQGRLVSNPHTDGATSRTGGDARSLTFTSGGKER